MSTNCRAKFKVAAVAVTDSSDEMFSNLFQKLGVSKEIKKKKLNYSRPKWSEVERRKFWNLNGIWEKLNRKFQRVVDSNLANFDN